MCRYESADMKVNQQTNNMHWVAGIVEVRGLDHGRVKVKSKKWLEFILEAVIRRRVGQGHWTKVKVKGQGAIKKLSVMLRQSP